MEALYPCAWDRGFESWVLELTHGTPPQLEIAVPRQSLVERPSLHIE